MIPQRIKLAGFLSYKDEQEIRLDGSPLWMLSGVNGSGKSSIFDAVTYALFGHHRGGSIQAAELVNKDSTALTVEFDFTIEDTLYRIKRTLKKLASGNKSTFQILKFTPIFDLTDGKWEPVHDTGMKVGFDNWIKDKIGLNYETFTSSVLLLQGKAEKLLDSTPSGRAGVLASIVDLERYQKLHGRADEKRKELKGRYELFKSQLDALRDVSDDEFALAEARIDEAEDVRGKAHERVDQLHAVELQARRWSETQARLGTVRAKLQHTESLLGHALAIEKQHARFRELRDVLPTIGTIVMERGRVSDSERKTDQFTKEQAGKEDRKRKLDHALETARRKLVSLKKTLVEDETKAATLNTKMRELAAMLEKVRLVEDQQTELTRLEDEVKRLPADAEARVRDRQEKLDHLALLSQALPSLIRIVDEKTELAQALHRVEAVRAEESRLLAEGKQAKTDFEAVQSRLAAAKQAREQSDSAMAEARAYHQQAKALADEFLQLSGSKSCRACGQPLTPGHFEDEKRKRGEDLREAQKRLQELTAATAEAREREMLLTQQEADMRRGLEDLRDRYKERAGEVKQTTTDIRRLSDSIRETYLGMPEPYKSRVSPIVPADWGTVTFPARDELAVFRREAAQIDAVRRQLREAQEAATQWQTLKAKTESARDRLAKVKHGLPGGDLVTLRQTFASGQSEETAVTNAIKATKKEIPSVELEIERLHKQRGETDRDLVALTGQLQNEENSRSQSHDTIGRLCKGLPEPWQREVELARLGEQMKWKQEFEDLQAKGIETKHLQLQQARGGLESIRAEILGLEKDADEFPPEARRAPEDVKQDVTAARKELDAHDRQVMEAKQARSVLEGYRRQRAELAEQHKAVDAEHVRFKMLAELLGRDRLQRHLVRQAERQIVDYANAVLDRLSGGQLFLRLIDADVGTDKALDLECSNRVTGGSAINVAFLSGSQRFRVAVSLALGIGQYASKQHRPIESVIIDEGFGCLDRAGRQVMIQELQNLRGHLRCILLVSHQEEFADAFPDGYRFELQNGATKVTRFER